MTSFSDLEFLSISVDEIWVYKSERLYDWHVHFKWRSKDGDQIEIRRNGKDLQKTWNEAITAWYSISGHGIPKLSAPTKKEDDNVTEGVFTDLPTSKDDEAPFQ